MPSRTVYAERPGMRAEPFLLPALYGGEGDATYDAMFVFQDPSESFTEKRWRPCANAAEAVRRHRAIFEDWASLGKAAVLFRRMDEVFARSRRAESSEPRPFFSRYYITDIWKDARWQGSDRSYRDYWLSKLEIEFREAAARHVILVGKEALKGRHLVPAGIPLYTLPFPGQWMRPDAFAAAVDRLVREMSLEVS